MGFDGTIEMGKIVAQSETDRRSKIEWSGIVGGDARQLFGDTIIRGQIIEKLTLGWVARSTMEIFGKVFEEIE
jgi:hypothetical protein